MLPLANVLSRLQIASNLPLVVREEVAPLPIEGKPCTLLYISDLHLGARNSRRIVEEVLERVHSHPCDLILLGGDFVDRRSALPLLEEFFQNLCQFAPTLAVPGNHDRFVAPSEIAAIARRAGVHWLLDSSAEFPEWNLVVDGVPRRGAGGMKSRILCVHNPVEFADAFGMDYTLGFAGHLHGSQFVLAKRDQSLYPGRLFFRWNVLREEHDNTLYLVSRGVNDSLPLRFNCPRELILCNLR